LARAGFEAIEAVEAGSDACATYSTLHPATRVEQARVEYLDFRRLRGAVALLAGGPPCQPFSTGGKQLGSSDDRDGFPEFLRVLDEVQPDSFLIENVAGLAATSMSRYFTWLLHELRELKFEVAWKVVNAADYGVPQRRRRLFVVGMRDRGFDFPAATHGPVGRRPWAASGLVLRPGQVLGDPNPSIVTYAERPDLRPSPYAGHLFNGGGRPIDLSVPAPTILAAAGGNKTPFLDTEEVVPPYHAHLVAGGAPRRGQVSGARRITVEESARLQTFPPQTAFAGRRSTQYTLVGNAVPPTLAEAIGAALHAALTNSDRQMAA
jgi:DNA (cytosine-5)-methyltransferase 1